MIEQKDIIRNNTYKDNTVTISEHKYNMASKISKELYVVTEDRGTTINIIAQILRLFAYDKNINLKCTYLGCHGNSYMSAVLLKYIPQNSLCIVIYDTGLSKDQYIEHEIGSTLKKVKNRLGVKIVKFTPYCIEECALTFKYLTNEIIGLDTWQKNYWNVLISIFKLEISIIL